MRRRVFRTRQVTARRIKLAGAIDLYEAPVDDAVAFSQTASFELGARAIQRIFTVMLAPFIAGKQFGLVKYFIDMLGVVGPVGGDVQGTARR